MQLRFFKTDTMRNYAKWNKALFEHFFPTRQEDPLLFVDDTLLDDIGSEIFPNRGNNWTDCFLRDILFDEIQIRHFRTDSKITNVKLWNAMVKCLLDVKTKIDDVPSYFAIICSIMYVAQRVGADHASMNTFARQEKYLNNDTTQLANQIHDLFTQLNKDCPSFNHQRMVSCRELSSRVNISRIKYHLVLRKREREDFIDFIQVNNLKWEDGTYKEFADYYLLPSLARAGKQHLIDKVKNEENNPYFRNLLTLPNLQFGRPTTFQNERQERTVYWRYELKFDFNTGEPVFIMTTRDVLGGITFNGGKFNHDPNSSEIADPLGSNVALSKIGDFEYRIGDKCYLLKNIANNNTFYFESAAQDHFNQVTDVLPGKHYLQFVPKKKRGRNVCPKGWEIVSDFTVPNFDIYEIHCYQGKGVSNNMGKDKVTDRFGFYNIGSYCRITLQENEELWWNPHVVNSHSERIEPFYGTDGSTYFRLRTNDGTRCISGSVFVKSRDGDREYVLMNESVYFQQMWDVASQRYSIDGWGNTIPYTDHINNTTIGNATEDIQNQLNKTDHTDILLNLLCELADENGCVSEIRLKNALNFVLQFYGIIDPNSQNRRKLIYALRRLGYIIGNKDVATGRYINQLVAPFVEKTLYYGKTRPTTSNLYLIKGVYSDKELEDFKNQNNIINLQYKRPYENSRGDLRTPGYCAENDSPEYRCLPDLVLFEVLNQNVVKWNCIQSPYAYTLLSNMGNMSDFVANFLNCSGDIYYGAHGNLPEMIYDDYHNEVLCFEDQAQQIRTLKNYQDPQSQLFLPIPKHLARVYCENEKNLPICIIDNGQTTDVSFLHKMGIPRVLDMALCDLNLGLPDEHKVFVIDHQISNLPIKKSANGGDLPYSDIKIYHNIYSTTWLTRLSSNNTSPQYIQYSRDAIKRWKMYLDEHKHRIIVTYNNYIFAYSECGNVYISDSQTQTFVQVQENRSVNELLSEMLHNYNNIQNWKIARVPVTPPTTIQGLIKMDIK